MFYEVYLFVLLSAVILSECGVSVHNPFYCYSEDPIKPQIRMFANRTPYNLVRGQINANASTCNPSKFWYFGKHGAMLPNPADIGKILEHNERLHREILLNYEKGRTSLCASDIELLKNWQFDPEITLERGRDLTSTGWQDIEQQGQRYHAAFPSLLPSTYSANHYFFRSANTNRSVGSNRAFADGLFGVNGYQEVEFEDIPEEDFLLEPYNQCPLWGYAVANDLERNEFGKGPEYQRMLSEVSAKLGFHGSHLLRNSEIEVLDILCKFENNFLNSTSPFCAAFSVANHQVIEYYDDLFFYYRFGYGNSNYRRLFDNFNCFLTQDLLRFLQSNDVNDHKARIYHSHIEVYNTLLVSLGVFRDVPLNRHNFAQQTDRLFRFSFVSPDAANLAVIRFE